MKLKSDLGTFDTAHMPAPGAHMGQNKRETENKIKFKETDTTHI